MAVRAARRLRLAAVCSTWWILTAAGAIAIAIAVAVDLRHTWTDPRWYHV
jgi:hypothetical protein